jgi:hypothetical protein
MVGNRHYIIAKITNEIAVIVVMKFNLGGRGATASELIRMAGLEREPSARVLGVFGERCRGVRFHLITAGIANKIGIEVVVFSCNVGIGATAGELIVVCKFVCVPHARVLGVCGSFGGRGDIRFLLLLENFTRGEA